MNKILLTSAIGCLGLLWCLGCETGEYLEDDADLFDSEEDGADDLSGRATLVGLYQAEKFTAQSGCQIATNKAGYSGTGFVDYGGNGTWIEFNNVNVAQAGSYTLKFRYATAANSRQCAVLVNGTNVGNVAFSSTGSWTTWGTASLTKSLRAGNNTIRILANTSSGGPNLDSIEVLSEIVATGSCVEAAENKTAALSCPTGKAIVSVNFASYGLPTGACPGGFATSTCHATSSLDKVKAACLSKPSCSVAASNGVFGDPCSGKPKKLAIVYTCGGTVVDNCPSDPNKTEPGLCGCGTPEGSCSACQNTLLKDEILSAGQYRCSADGKYKFGMSSGGNLALLEGTKTLWSANTCCGAAFVAMQGDGNLVVYDGSSPKWASNTSGRAGASLTVENNGTAVIRYNGSIIWSVGNIPPVDNCPNDPNKTQPGQCGCGVPEGSCGGLTLDRVAGTELRVAAYNVMRSSNFPLDNGNPGKTGSAARIDGFKRIANAVDADIWAMQELMYDGNDQPGRTPAGLKRHLEKITGGTWYMAHHVDYQEFVFSRYPIDASGSASRRVVWALIDVGNDNDRRNDVVVISVHFVTDGHGNDVANLVNSILAGKQAQIPKDVTIVIAGDFNNQPTGVRYAAVRSAIGVPDVRPIWLGTPDTTFTHGGVTYKNGAFKAPSGGSPIDYIFARTNGRYAVAKNFILSTLVLDQSVLNAHGLQRLDVALNPGQSVSEGVNVNCDHFPLIADLRPIP